MRFLLLTIPVTLLVSGVLLFFVLRAARQGQFDDWEGPAWRMLCDDDRDPEVEGDDPAPIDPALQGDDEAGRTT